MIAKCRGAKVALPAAKGGGGGGGKKGGGGGDEEQMLDGHGGGGEGIGVGRRAVRLLQRALFGGGKKPDDDEGSNFKFAPMANESMAFNVSWDDEEEGSMADSTKGANTDDDLADPEGAAVSAAAARYGTPIAPLPDRRPSYGGVAAAVPALPTAFKSPAAPTAAVRTPSGSFGSRSALPSSRGGVLGAVSAMPDEGGRSLARRPPLRKGRSRARGSSERLAAAAFDDGFDDFDADFEGGSGFSFGGAAPAAGVEPPPPTPPPARRRADPSRGLTPLAAAAAGMAASRRTLASLATTRTRLR